MMKKPDFKSLEPNKKIWFLHPLLEFIGFFPKEAVISKLRFRVMGPVMVTVLYQEIPACDLPAINTGNISFTSHSTASDEKITMNCSTQKDKAANQIRFNDRDELSP
jgi:hypothetical protein